MSLKNQKLNMDALSDSGSSLKLPRLKTNNDNIDSMYEQSDSSSISSMVTKNDINSPINSCIIKEDTLDLTDESSGSDDELELKPLFRPARYRVCSSSNPFGFTTGSIIESSARNLTLRRASINATASSKFSEAAKPASGLKKVSAVTTSGLKKVSAIPASAPEKLPPNPKENAKLQLSITTPKMLQKPPPKTKPVAERHLPVVTQSLQLQLKYRADTKLEGIIAAPLVPPKIFTQPARAAVPPRFTCSSNGTMTEFFMPLWSEVTGNTKERTLSLPLQECRLRGIENLLARVEARMKSNMEKSEEMVEEAKNTLVNRLPQRLKNLYTLTARQKDLKIEPATKARQDSTKSLHQQRLNLQALALNFGRELRGDDYKLPAQKSFRLAKNICLFSLYKNMNEQIEVKEEQPKKDTVTKEKVAKAPREDELRTYRHANAITCPLNGRCRNARCKYQHLPSSQVP